MKRYSTSRAISELVVFFPAPKKETKTKTKKPGVMTSSPDLRLFEI